MDTHKLYSWIVSLLEDDGFVDENHLKSKVELEDLDHILFLLNYLLSKGYVKAEVTGNSIKYFSQDIVEIKKALERLGSTTSEISQQEIQDCAVVSIPISLTEEFERMRGKHKLQVMLLKDAIKLLISSARKEVLITSPFIEWDGMIYILDDVAKAAKNGASMRLITRDIIDSRDGFSHVEKLKTISKLLSIYETNKSRPDNTFAVRDHGRRISGLGRTSMHYEGIHQKMVVVDRRYAYIGSGEIRAASLVTNGEVGHIVTGTEAEFWSDFFDIFWKDAKEIPKYMLESKI